MRSITGREGDHVGSGASRRGLLAHRPVTDAPHKLAFTYTDSQNLKSWLAERDRHPLALLSFGATVSDSLNCPVVRIDLPQLVAPRQVELWSSADPVHVIREKGVCLSMSGDIAVAVLSAEEEPGTALDRVTCLAYQRLLTILQRSGYPHIWRAWNYFPRINDYDEGLERYQRFCLGRHQALAEALPDFPASLPAGTAVGTGSGPLQIVLLAGSKPARHLGNPRQVNAYEYPEHYGPRSPSFARATISAAEGPARLFVAGTASIVGHTSRHGGLPREQTTEMMQNLRALLEHADTTAGGEFLREQRRGLFKIYVRHPDHLPVIKAALHEARFAPDQLLFLQGHLCRRELLVEIEGLIAAD
jgi:chorismate lyase / 3-hydroxybenzoate synthase